MTPGWRRWAAILTTCTCFVAGAIPYRIRVPPPGQLVALSGDDLRVELDLPPPGAGQPLGAPETTQRRQGEAGKEEAATASGGGRVRRDGELWIELVDMELGDERVRRRKEEEKKTREEEEERAARWRRERGGGEEGDIGRREIGGWNSVELKGKGRHEKKAGSKRYGWVAGGVRPKGEKENVVKVEGKEAGEGGRWKEENRSGKWAGGKEGKGDVGRQKTEGKIWWKSWNGRGVGAGRERGGYEGGGEAEGGGGEEGDGRGKEEEGDAWKGEGGGKEGSEEEGRRRRGLILESALVSRGWHLLEPAPAPPRRGPSSPHSTLALTFPASHFTHGGLYVVRLVGTGRMVANSGTQRPQRATPSDGEVNEAPTLPGIEEEWSTQRGLVESKKNSTREKETNPDANVPENQMKKPKEINDHEEEETSEANTRANTEVDAQAEETNYTTDNPVSATEKTDAKDEGDKSGVEPEKTKDGGGTANSDTAQMFGKIVETLENRFKWNEVYAASPRNPSGRTAEERKTLPKSARSTGDGMLPPAKRRKREVEHGKGKEALDGKERVASSNDYGDPSSSTADEEGGGISSGSDVQTQKTTDGSRYEHARGPRGDGGGVGGKRRVDHRRGSDYEEAPGEGQWEEAVGEGSRRGSDESVADRKVETEGRRRRDECGEEEGASGASHSEEVSAGVASGFKTYLENKAGNGSKRAKRDDDAEPESQREILRERRGGGDEKEERKEKDGAVDCEKKKTGMKRGEEAREEANGERGESSRQVIGPDSTRSKVAHHHSTVTGKSGKGNSGEEKEGNATDAKVRGSAGPNGILDGRVSREASKGCKGNCDSATRHILAEENVLVSWPTARFTLNILSSNPTVATPFSTPTSTSKDDLSQNVTFGTFERPVKVLVEIPCGVGKVSGRSRREVVGRLDDSDEERIMEPFKEDVNDNFVDLWKGGEKENSWDLQSDGYFGKEVEDKLVSEKEFSEGVYSKEVGKRRRKKGEREEAGGISWEANEREDSSYTGRRRKGEGNHASFSVRYGGPSLRNEESDNYVSKKTEEGESANPGLATSTRVRSRIRKERVTKFDINDDQAERFWVTPDKPERVAMKREASKRREIESVGRGSKDGHESLKASESGVGEDSGSDKCRGHLRGGRRKRAAREGIPDIARNIPAARDSRNPKTGLTPGPLILPFRLFLVLRYCGPDSTECDEEESRRYVDAWRRPQTVFTEELADFPDCPNYRHQVILPCEAFGQAGVYLVQVRSNYTVKEGEGDGGGEKEEEGGGLGGKRRKRNEGGAEGESKRLISPDATTSRTTGIKEGVKISVLAGEIESEYKHSTSIGSHGESESTEMDMGEDRNAERKDEGPVGKKGASKFVDVGESPRRMEHREGKGGAGLLESVEAEALRTVKSKGEIVNRHGYAESTGSERSGTVVWDASAEESSGGGGKRRGREADAWDGGDNWWEGSGDGEGDDGSGGWGEAWGEEGGRERRRGSGDGEYGDDPGSGEQLTSPQKLPEPPPPSLWSSSEAIHVHLSKGYVFTVHARSVFPCSDAHVKPETLEPAPSGVPVLFEYPQCILEGSDRVRVFGRARPDVSAILPPFWLGSDASVGAAATLSHPSLRYVAEKKIYKGKHTAWFDCSLFTERFSEYCFAYASEAVTGAVTHVRAQCIPTLPTSDEDRGGWGSWSSWSQCSTTCGGGSRNRYRTCDNPPPRYGAPFCEGTALETERCPPPSSVTYEELQEMCPLGLALSAGDGVNRREGEPSCRCGGCIVHLQGSAGSWGSHNAGPIKSRARLVASSSQACPGRSFWLLQAEPGHVVGLTVSSLLLPCPRRQWLKARDGDSLSSRLILHLPSSSSGASSLSSNAETLCFSSGPNMLLEFYSFERLEPTCNGGFLAHAHQVLANSSASMIGREILLAPTTRAVLRSSISVHAAAMAFVLALVALSGGLALNYVLRRRRFNDELKKREKEDEEMSDSDSDTKCFIARNKDGGSATSVTSVSDVISLRKLPIGRDGKRREVHMRLREETDEDEDDEDDDDGATREADGKKGAGQTTDSNAPAKITCPKVVVLEPGAEVGKKVVKGGGGSGGEGEERAEEVAEVTRRRRRKGAGGAVRREWRESACPLLEKEAVAQSSVSLPSSPTESLSEDPTADPNAPGRPGLSASAPLLLRRSLSFFAAAASASTAGAASDSSSEGGGQRISAAGRQWWRKKMQRFQNGSVSPVREELEETWRLADPQTLKEEPSLKSKRKQSSEATPAKECKEKQNRERLLRAGAGGFYPTPPSSNPSASPSATTSPEMGARSGSGGRLRGRLRARVDERGKCTSEASLAGGASELDLEFDYYDYNVQNAGAAPGSYLGMDPAFLVYIPPFEGSSSPSSEASSASTLQAPPSEADVCAASPHLQNGAGRGKHRGEYYCINASYARANFQEAGGAGGGGGGGGEDGPAEGSGEMVSLAEFRRNSLEERRGSEKETRVEKSPALEEEEEIKFADEEEEEDEEEEVVRVKKEEDKYGMIKMENLGIKRPV